MATHQTRKAGPAGKARTQAYRQARNAKRGVVSRTRRKR